VINANEGGFLVNPATNTTITTPDYLANLFPQLGSKEIQAGTGVYAGLGLSAFQQAILIVAEGPSFYSSCVHCILLKPF